MTWLIKNHKELIDADYAINEGGGVGLRDGKPQFNSIQTTEKRFQSFWLEVRNPGGHSSQPGKDNAIYELAECAQARLEQVRLPDPAPTTTTRGFFDKMSTLGSASSRPT